ncbi:MAG: hypothetical protein ACFFC7_32900 [Candidatus Hermodarchaeota archaeon]
MVDILTLILETFSLICLIIVSLSLLRVYFNQKELPALLMSLSYLTASLSVSIIFVRDLFSLPYRLLFIEDFFDTFPLMLVPFTTTFMWLFKLEVFNDGLRSNQRKIIVYGIGLAILTAFISLEMLFIDLTMEQYLIVFGLASILLAYALGSYLYSLISILPEYEEKTYRVKTQFLLLSLILFVICLGFLLISLILLNILGEGDVVLYESIAWLFLAFSSIMALFSFRTPRFILRKLGLEN